MLQSCGETNSAASYYLVLITAGLAVSLQQLDLR